MIPSAAQAPLEIWGGHECTVSRIGDLWRDQTILSGHDERPDDLDLFAELGLQALRYPVIWERIERSRGEFDWSWSDARLSRLRASGVRPIAGLAHHGSGPAWTNLTDTGFASGLAEFAARVADRYPWITDWTPVNEPLTTARFSTLYGHWYPHLRDETACWTALLNQIEATQLAMAEIRKVIPHARLVQTEDFGCTYGTEPCAEQAAFENDRRLLTWDLLTGRVVAGHSLWARFERLGFAAWLERIAARSCPPDLIGLNHYVTSNRFLDHRLERYPIHARGGNAFVRYADVEAVRVVSSLPCGWSECLKVLHDRYGLPIAITECHLGGDVEHQRRWLMEAWRAATRARTAGRPVEALTVWSLLGSYDWDSLLTRCDGRYEPGAFDVRSGVPVPTSLGDFVRVLAGTGSVNVAAPPAKGWWSRKARLEYPPYHRRRRPQPSPLSPPKQLIQGDALSRRPVPNFQ